MSEVDRAPLLEGTAPSATADGGDVDAAWISASSWSRISEGGLSYAPLTRDTRGIVTTGRWNYAAVAKVGGL